MKIDDLKNSFDAISPTPEQKDKMLTEILNAEDKVKGFNFTRLFTTAIGLAAVIAISVVAFNYGDFNVTEYENMVAYKTEEPAQKKTIKEENAIKKSAKTEKKENVQVAAPVTEDKTETIVAEAPVPMSMARTIENPENVEAEDANENSGIAVASEENEHNLGIAVVSEENTTDNVEWMTVPALEEVEDLEEENVRTEEDKETEEELEEETEENEEETKAVTE